MANGDPVRWQRELPEVEAFFARISKVLEDFAALHNLMIDRYHHECEDWTFRFRHPKGGVGNILVRKSGQDRVWIATFWWLDDYDARRRFSKHSEGKDCDLDQQRLGALLEDMFKVVLSWNKEDLVPSRSMHLEWNKSRAKELLERSVEEYPIPKMD